MNKLNKLFKTPLPSARSGAFFNTFSYPTKISPESIAVYIAAATKPGDLVLDTFSGSGSTGIAALLCEHPTARMKQLADELGISPLWGARNAIGYEIGTYGSFAAETITSRLKADDFQEVFDDFIENAETQWGNYYCTKDEEGKEGRIRYIIWSEILKCPHCGTELPYFTYGTRRNPVKFEKKINCFSCGHISAVDEMDYVKEEYYDILLKQMCIRKKRVPVWVYGITEGRNWDRPANKDDIDFIKELELVQSDEKDFPKKIEWGELHRNGYHFGISYLHQFYTIRNYQVMRKLWLCTEKYKEKNRDALRLLLLSYNASHCTMMTRVVGKKNAKDFVLTGAQSGVLYISKLPVEKNIFMGLRRKAASFYNAYKLLENCTGEFVIRNMSSRKLKEKSSSIDFVFTDPPFGDFIPYAEVNQMNELWLDSTTDRSEEIIISSSQKKDLRDYKRMLTDVFSEINRVLKEKSSAAVVFHAAKAQVWSAFENAMNDAGLNVELTNILDKKQSSFKQVVSGGSVQRDPLLLLKKESRGSISSGNEQRILKKIAITMEVEEKFDERKGYSLYVNECLRNRIEVTYDAKDAYVFMRQFRKGILDGAIR